MAIFTRTVILFLLLSITTPYLVLSYPNGADTCNADVKSISVGHGAPTTSGVGGYSLSVKSGASGSFDISINGPGPVNGVLIYTQDSKGTRTGNFVVPSNFQQKSCSGSGTNTLTHTDSNPKSMPLKFSWSSSSSTNMTVKALVVLDPLTSYYVLSDATFDPTSGSVSTGPTTSSNSTNAGDTTASSGASSSGSGNGFFQQNTLFVVLILISAFLYVTGSFVEASLKRQQIKERAFAKAVGGFDQ